MKWDRGCPYCAAEQRDINDLLKQRSVIEGLTEQDDRIAELEGALKMFVIDVKNWMSFGNECPMCHHHYNHDDECAFKIADALLDQS